MPAPGPRITESPSSATERDIAARVLARIATAPPQMLVGEPERVSQQRSPWRRRVGLLAAALTLAGLTIAGALGIRSWFASRRTSPPAGGVATVGQRRSVAVLGLKNSTGKPDADWLSTALAEMLTTELGAVEQLRTIPDENVARMKMDLHLSDADTLAAGTLTRVRKNLGTDYVVLGSYTDLPKKSGGEIRVDLRLQDTEAGETIALVAETGSEADLFDLVSRAGTQLREKLGVAQVTAEEAHVVRASLPSNPEAARLYAEGLAKLRVYDSLSARDLLERAVAADPQHSLAHSALSQAWWNLGYDSRARDEAKRAMDQSASLSREDGLLIEGRYWETANQWDKAIEVFTTLFRSFPDNVEYGLLLAGAQSRAGKGKDALVTVEALRKLPPPARDDPRIDYAEQGAASSLSDFKHMTTAAETVVAKASAQGATLLIARGQMGLGWAFGYLGDSKKAIAAFEEAKRIFAAAGDRQDEAFAINGIALVLKDEGDLSDATTRFNDAGAIFREIGNKRGEVVVLCNLSQMLTKTGDLAGARKAASEATIVARQIGDKVNLGLGYFLLGTALYESGELGAAKKALEQTLAISQEDGYQMGRVWALFGLGQVSLYEGDLAGSRKMYDEGLSIMNRLGVKPSLAEGQTSMAELYIEEGRPAEAEPLLREALAEFRGDNSLDDEAWACSVLARALLAEGKLSEAGEQIKRAQERSANSQDVTTHLLVAITAARVRAAKGQPVPAVQDLTARSPKRDDTDSPTTNWKHGSRWARSR